MIQVINETHVHFNEWRLCMIKDEVKKTNRINEEAYNYSLVRIIILCSRLD